MNTETETLPENVPKNSRKTILDSFRLLSINNEDKRLKNALILLKHVCTSSSNENEKGELTYALNRLVRGLGSSTNVSRTGFFSILVTLLSTTSCIEVEDILASIKKELQITSSNSKRENGDIYLGQILAAGALVHSKLFSKASDEQKVIILDLLFRGREGRRYLYLVASTFIVDLINLVDKKTFDGILWPKLLVETVRPWEEQTLDDIYILLTVQNKFPGVNKITKFCTCFGKNGIVAKCNVEQLCDILFKVIDVASLKHPGYALLSQEIAKSSSLSTFIVTLDLQLTKPSRNKLLVVSSIVRNMFSYVKTSEQIPQLLTKNFIQNMILYLQSFDSKSDKEFQTELKLLFEGLINSLKSDEVKATVKIAVITKFLFDPGTLMFEKIARSKIIQQLVQTLNAEGVMLLSNLYKNIIVNEDEDHTKVWSSKEKVYASQMLVKLLNHPKVQAQVDWKLDYMKLFIDLSIIKSEQTISNSDTLRELFFKTLDQKLMKLEETSTLLSSLVNHLKPTIMSADPSAFQVLLQDKDFKVLKKMYKITSKLSKKEKGDNYTNVFLILFYHMTLQVFKNKELAISSLEELFMCYERINNEKELRNKKDEPQWIEVVIDLFLNLLSHNSRFFRSIIGSVFPHLCTYLTPSSIQQILSVFDPKSETNPLSNIEDESDENDEEAPEDENEDNDEESDFEVDEHETVTDKLRLAVQQALRNDDCKTDDESIDLDQMSDGEGDRLNDALATAFKQFQNKGVNKKQNEDDLVLMNFRIRVLDLIELYLSHRPSLLSCLEIMPALLNTLEFAIPNSNQEPLQLRVRACLKKLTQIKKFANEAVDNEILAKLLQEITEKGARSTLIYQYMMKDIADCCVFIIRNSQLLYTTNKLQEPTNITDDPVIQVGHDLLCKFIEERNFVLPYSVLTQVFPLHWHGNLFLIPILFKSAFKSKSTKQKQILNLIKAFYVNRRTQYEAKTFKLYLSKSEINFCKQIIKKLNKFCQNPCEENKISEALIVSLLMLLKMLFIHPFKNEDVNWTEVADKLKEFRSQVTFSKETQNHFNELCKVLKVSNVVTMKENTTKLNSQDDQDEEKVEIASKQNVRMKDRQEVLKMKKEARKLRLESMSKGLSNGFSFADFNGKEETEIKDEEMSIKDESDNDDESDQNVKESDTDENSESDEDVSVKEESSDSEEEEEEELSDKELLKEELSDTDDSEENSNKQLLKRKKKSKLGPQKKIRVK